jgi:hypothetical protein
MDLSDLLSCLNDISNEDTEHIISQIMQYMQSASELGNNHYTYYFKNNENILQIINWLKYYFPDVVINTFTNYIIIDWS